MKEKAKEEIQLCRLKMENNFEKAQTAVREKLKSTLELAKDAEKRWIQATPSDRVVCLKKVVSNLVLDGATVRYDLKVPFRLLAQIKNKRGSEKWCARRDLNPHALRH